MTMGRTKRTFDYWKQHRQNKIKKEFVNFIQLNDGSYAYDYTKYNNWEEAVFAEMTDVDNSFTHFKEVLSIIYDPEQFKYHPVYKNFDEFAKEVLDLNFFTELVDFSR